MIDELIERRDQIEHEIFIIEGVDGLRQEERHNLHKLHRELLDIRLKIEKEKQI